MQQLPKLSSTTLKLLKNGKNLLAYSAGSDSNALFFILQAHGISFDIALVNYQTRIQSDEEEAYAKTLAKEYEKKCFTFTCKLPPTNFEHHAREARYSFFDKIISENGYQNLLTAHHLNDRFEWFLMQLAKGAGSVELLGFEEVDKQKNYNTIRPLINTSKEEIETFLHVNQIKHFLDETNYCEKYTRNRIRKEFANPFIKEYKEGILKSFAYLSLDAKALESKIFLHVKNLYILQRETNDTINIRGIDKVVKKLGYLLSSAQREEILKTRDCVIANSIAISFTSEFIYIAPFVKLVMPKEFKELCRIHRIPKNIRSYLLSEEINPSAIHTL